MTEQELNVESERLIEEARREIEAIKRILQVNRERLEETDARRATPALPADTGSRTN